MYDIQYVFQAHLDELDNKLSKIVSQLNVRHFSQIYDRYCHVVQFMDRHMHTNNVSLETQQTYHIISRYMVTYGYVFFTKLNWTEMDCIEQWIVDYLHLILNNIQSMRFVDTLTLKLYTIPDDKIDYRFICGILLHPIMIKDSFCELTSDQIERKSIFGKMLCPVQCNVELSNRELSHEIRKKCLDASITYVRCVYEMEPETITRFFISVIVSNSSKLQVFDSMYKIDEINTYTFLCNCMVIAHELLNDLLVKCPNNKDYQQCFDRLHNINADISDLCQISKLFYIAYSLYRITFYSLLLQNMNCKNIIQYNTVLSETLNSYVELNNRYIRNECYIPSVIHIISLYCNSFVENCEQSIIREETLYEILYFWNNFAEASSNSTYIDSVKCEIFQFIYHMILKKESFTSPFVKITALKILYLLEKFRKLNIKQICPPDFLSTLYTLFIHINSLVGVDLHTEKFFYKTYILEMIMIVWNTHPNMIIPIDTIQNITINVWNDILQTLEYLIDKYRSIVITQNYTIESLQSLISKTMTPYIDRYHLQIEFLIQYSYIYATDPVMYHIVNFCCCYLKIIYDNVLLIKMQGITLWDVLKTKLLGPLHYGIKQFITTTNFVHISSRYFPEFHDYMMKLDIDILAHESIYRVYHNYLSAHPITDIYDGLPDEFLDPIMGCIINRPYELPTSKMIVDSTIILSHLIQFNNQYDPYNRQPLDIQTLLEYNMLTDVRKRCFELVDKRDIWIIENNIHPTINRIMCHVSFSNQVYYYDTRSGLIYV
jgi:hypothetical protein